MSATWPADSCLEDKMPYVPFDPTARYRRQKRPPAGPPPGGISGYPNAMAPAAGRELPQPDRPPPPPNPALIPPMPGPGRAPSGPVTPPGQAFPDGPMGMGPPPPSMGAPPMGPPPPPQMGQPQPQAAPASPGAAPFEEEDDPLGGMSKEQIEQLTRLGILPEMNSELDTQMSQATALRNQGQPIMRENRRVSTAANPLEFLGTGIQKYKAGKQIEALRKSKQENLDAAAKGRAEYLAAKYGVNGG